MQRNSRRHRQCRKVPANLFVSQADGLTAECEAAILGEQCHPKSAATAMQWSEGGLLWPDRAMLVLPSFAGSMRFADGMFRDLCRFLRRLGMSFTAAVMMKGAQGGNTPPSDLSVQMAGSQPDGTAFAADQDRTCGNWTKSAQGSAMVGHHDRMGLKDDEASRSWNSSHPSRGSEGGCSQADLRSTGGRSAVLLLRRQLGG